jgi:hypothetical protein
VYTEAGRTEFSIFSGSGYYTAKPMIEVVIVTTLLDLRNVMFPGNRPS